MFIFILYGANVAKSISRLWITEKPSVSVTIVDTLCRVYGLKVLNQKTYRKDGFYELSNNHFVSNVIGHLIQMQPPSRYLNKEQNSDPMSALPLLPDPFLFEPKSETNKDGSLKLKNGKPYSAVIFTILKKLILRSKEIVNVCDTDREGQLIFDELLEFVGVSPYSDNIFRAALFSHTDAALEKCVKNLDQNAEQKWKGKSMAAGTRQVMDWILGMNASMAFQAVTGIRTMSVGRVQTPVLNLVVQRDLAIENFVSKPYFIPVAILQDGTRLRWDKREGSDAQVGFDERGRIVDEALAQSILTKIQSGATGTVLVSKKEEKSEAPPLPFSMGDLQAEASRKHGLSVADVTKAAQNLYEKHKAITYVGTDSQYLPEDMFDEANTILESLAQHFPTQVNGADPKIKSKAFNDSKVEEHFAIIPTGIVPSFSASESKEKAVYETVCNRYIAQFYPDARSLTATLVVGIDDDRFKATANKVLQTGWKAIEGRGKKDRKKA